MIFCYPSCSAHTHTHTLKNLLIWFCFDERTQAPSCFCESTQTRDSASFFQRFICMNFFIFVFLLIIFLYFSIIQLDRWWWWFFLYWTTSEDWKTTSDTKIRRFFFFFFEKEKMCPRENQEVISLLLLAFTAGLHVPNF